jgi:teichuronic acid biosynthesis glycosyltransferase TuaC
MNVLSFTTLWPNPVQPLHGLFVRERLNALVKLCDIQVVAPIPWFVPLKMLSAQYYQYTQVPHTEQHGAIKVFHPRFVVLPKLAKFLDGWLMFQSVRNYVRRLRHDFPFELIDAHYAYPDGYAAGQLAKALGVPYTVTVRGSDVTLLAREKFRGSLIRQCLQEAKQVICVAESLHDDVVGTLGISPANVTVIRNGVDCQKFYPIPQAEARRQLNLPADVRLVLSVGHLRELKGFDLLIHAISMIHTHRETFPPVHLVLVGGDYAWELGYKERLTRQIAECGVQERVSLVGPKPPDELKYWYSAADLFCLASSREGCPNVVLESLACGTPVVATPVGEIPKLVPNQDIGLLVERNPGCFQQGMLDALHRSWDRHTIVDYVQTQYAWEKTATTIYNLFEKIIL